MLKFILITAALLGVYVLWPEQERIVTDGIGDVSYQKGEAKVKFKKIQSINATYMVYGMQLKPLEYADAYTAVLPLGRAHELLSLYPNIDRCDDPNSGRLKSEIINAFLIFSPQDPTLVDQFEAIKHINEQNRDNPQPTHLRAYNGI